MRSFPILAAMAAAAFAQIAHFLRSRVHQAVEELVRSARRTFTVLPNRLDVSRTLSLGYLIEQAYDLPRFQVSAPDWVFEHHYDVMATSGAPVNGLAMRTMLRNLLSERFHLATHWEDKTEAIFHLTVLPGGPKMKVADGGFAMPNSPMIDGNALHLNGPMSMRQLAEQLATYAGRPVLDVTNLDGYFIIELHVRARGRERVGRGRSRRRCCPRPWRNIASISSWFRPERRSRS